MADVATLKTPGRAFGVVEIMGKITRKRRHEGTTYTAVVMPAADEYSKPQNVEVRSKSSLGDVGEIATLTCRLGGYERKAYQATDKNTGEVTRLIPVDLTLDLVE